MALLEVSDLSIDFPTQEGVVHAADHVSLTVNRGETVGVVGETGSGKSVTAMGILGLLDTPGHVVGGSVTFDGRDLVCLPEDELLQIRGKRIGMIFQEPSTSLNPTSTVGAQLNEALMTEHYDAWRASALRGMGRSIRAWITRDRKYRANTRAEAIQGLSEVHMPGASDALSRYPFMLSGGMVQRAMIAIALASRPALLIADEPTTALDVTIQAQIIEILRERRAATDLAMLLITHDLGLIAELCDRVVVMYAGRVVETGRVEELFDSPMHPYTRGLIASMPSIDKAVDRLRAMEGSVPRVIGESASACYFAPRCPLSTETCRRATPALQEVSEDHEVACHAYSESAMAGAATRIPTLWEGRALWPSTPTGLEPSEVGSQGMTGISKQSTTSSPRPVLEVVDLHRHFDASGTSRILGSKQSIRAVDGISFTIDRGETLALVGESGCGKTTAAEVVLLLQPATAGEIIFGGARVQRRSREELRGLRANLQVVFQNPRSSLSPRMKIRDILLEPLAAQAGGVRRLRRQGIDPRAQVQRLLGMVGLDSSVALHYPHALSGGQAQRVAIARALALQPELIVLDEPTSALDVSVQAQIVNLLKQLQRELHLTYLFISHDLRVVHNVSDRIAVMYLGAIVETGKTDKVFSAPAHPYTQALLSAIPRRHPNSRVERRILLPGDVPSPTNIPSGCRFRTRCPLAADICAEKAPQPVEVAPGQFAACHFAGADARAAGTTSRPSEELTRG